MNADFKWTIINLCHNDIETPLNTARFECDQVIFLVILTFILIIKF